MEYCVLNELGEVDKCFDRESELKRYIVPFPFPGFSALWYTKQVAEPEGRARREVHVSRSGVSPAERRAGPMSELPAPDTDTR